MMLLGSSIVPVLIIIGKREVQLGEIVRRAFAESGLDAPGWNTLPALDREGRIAKTIYDMRDEADEAARAAPPPSKCLCGGRGCVDCCGPA